MILNKDETFFISQWYTFEVFDCPCGLFIRCMFHKATWCSIPVNTAGVESIFEAHSIYHVKFSDNENGNEKKVSLHPARLNERVMNVR